MGWTMRDWPLLGWPYGVGQPARDRLKPYVDRGSRLLCVSHSGPPIIGRLVFSKLDRCVVMKTEGFRGPGSINWGGFAEIYLVETGERIYP